MLVLGLESSCDETAAAIVDERGRVVADVVRTQIELHAPYGGVVPEIAARDHLRAVVPVLRQALADASLELEAIDAIAVTHRPGLVGALLVGLQLAKGLAWALDKPIVGVDHLVGHLASVFLQRETPSPVPTFPFVGLLVSGGHTALYRCDALDQIRELGATRDDAVGEAFDKVGKILGLGYPGGPAIDRLAAQGDPTAIELPSPMAHRRSLEFSFSGLKSAMARHIAQHPPEDEARLADLCAAFQQVIVRTLVRKVLQAAKQEELSRVVVAGGVAANRGLRRALESAAEAKGLEVFVPSLRSCTDNAAMIAYAGAVKLATKGPDDLALAPASFTTLPRVTRKGRGRR